MSEKRSVVLMPTLVIPAEVRADAQNERVVNEKKLIGAALLACNSKSRSSTSERNWETGEGLSYLIPDGEVLAYLFLLNQYNHHFIGPTDVYQTNRGARYRNVTPIKQKMNTLSLVYALLGPVHDPTVERR